MEKTYTQKEMEKLCRNAMFHGELFGRNVQKKILGLEHSLPNGETFEDVSYNWLRNNKIIPQ